MNVMCDHCILEIGIKKTGMSGPGSMDFSTGADIVRCESVWRCAGCGRLYDPDRGYYDIGAHGVQQTPRRTPRCESDQISVMFIEEVLSHGQVRYRCPRCRAERIDSIAD